jgi:hypothetical protein
MANEAQDIDPVIWDARFDPMAASTNATTLFMGTVWDRSLTASLAVCRSSERPDGEAISTRYVCAWKAM